MNHERMPNDAPRLLLSLLQVLLVCTAATAGAEERAEPLGAEDFGAEQHVVRIPEPMVFDLVRPLGALRGELEANILVMLPMNDWEDREVDWAPEIEYAVRDGLALEFELPFEDQRLAAYKLAGQLTFGAAFDDRFIHGAQFIAEAERGERAWDLTSLYLAGFRFDESWSALGMLGYRGAVGSEAPRSHELVANLSVFQDLTQHTTAGIESNSSADFDGRWHLLIIPQLHHELTDHLELQLGAGLDLNSGHADGTAALRFIASW